MNRKPQSSQNTWLKSLNAKLGLFIFASLLTGSANATLYTVNGTQLSIYSQSGGESTAHLIRSSKPIYNAGAHPWCGNRAYIDMNDAALYAAALAFSTNKQSVNFIYEDNAEQKISLGHIGFGCKVISIYQ